MNRILVLGGYGAVGLHAVTALVSHLRTTDVVVAGRNPHRAPRVPGSTVVRLDAADSGDLATALNGVDAVLMCAELDNARIARACLERGIHYVDVSASHQLHVEIEQLDELAAQRQATAALSVGLVPGVSNLLARHCVEQSTTRQVHIGVLLGSGERHGPAALAWTLDGLGRLHGSWAMRFPAPHGERTVHRFPFSDQYTLSTTLNVAASTGLCLDSRLTTALLAAAGQPGIARLLHRPWVRRIMLDALAKIKVGGDGFAVTVDSGASQASFSGRQQSRATGLAAALLIRDLPAMPSGVRHIEHLVEPRAFLTELAANGFTLNLGS
ncbi:saccharopine dehydrogenase family protein [Salinispora tropica]|uniref:Saccharopine dehydrogenase n=1 Tax=Salinispora tropica (strain ATCC BAA-916 / DSM 44818 / JCM 13857 / NBRC 105044 / CNB-440) TaxID=369723 RepID=A4X419_SALTO|nr:saccharopine dehydrogenase NADP-binding domain-containing protein [Salinispora tropica]ABP53619.1 Saccharopine dehydrogenase [Salinispora tropica CNB-440]